MLGDNKPKPLRQIAAETGMSITTVRRWAEIDHYDEWFKWWPSFNAIWADIRKGQATTIIPSATFEFADIDSALADELRDERY